MALAPRKRTKCLAVAHYRVAVSACQSARLVMCATGLADPLYDAELRELTDKGGVIVSRFDTGSDEDIVALCDLVEKLGDLFETKTETLFAIQTRLGVESPARLLELAREPFGLITHAIERFRVREKGGIVKKKLEWLPSPPKDTNPC